MPPVTYTRTGDKLTAVNPYSFKPTEGSEEQYQENLLWAEWEEKFRKNQNILTIPEIDLANWPDKGEYVEGVDFEIKYEIMCFGVGVFARSLNYQFTNANYYKEWPSQKRQTALWIGEKKKTLCGIDCGCQTGEDCHADPILRLAETEESGRNWTEDFTHENGNYNNICMYCEKQFIGHKRRVVCKLCSTPAIATTEGSDVKQGESVDVNYRESFDGLRLWAEEYNEHRRYAMDGEVDDIVIDAILDTGRKFKRDGYLSPAQFNEAVKPLVEALENLLYTMPDGSGNHYDKWLKAKQALEQFKKKGNKMQAGISNKTLAEQIRDAAKTLNFLLIEANNKGLKIDIRINPNYQNTNTVSISSITQKL